MLGECCLHCDKDCPCPDCAAELQVSYFSMNFSKESRSLILDSPPEVKPLRQCLILCRCFAEQTVSLCLKGRLHRSEVLLRGELHLPCVCVGFFPNKLIPKNNPYSFSFPILQDTRIFTKVFPLWKALPLKITNVQSHVREEDTESALNFSCRGCFCCWGCVALHFLQWIFKLGGFCWSVLVSYSR